MLIEFRFKNYYSYKDEAVLNLTKVKAFKELPKNTFKTSKGLDLLKTTVVYGTNGGGKSNLISAMTFMREFIHNSFADSLKKEEDRFRTDYYFKLSTLTERAPTLFEVSFIVGDAIYRYGFQIQRWEIISEWLFKKVDVETLLFERKNGKFTINGKGFSEGNKYKNDVNSNVLFLSHLAQNNAKESSKVFGWFKFLNVISGLDESYHDHATKELLDTSTNFKAWLNLAVRFLEITNIEETSDKKLITHHNKYDQNDIIVDSVEFNVDYDESAGTQKMIYLLGALYDTLRHGKVLFIDELDAKLHPNLSIKLLQLFNKFNTRNAQFIITAHDAILMDKEYLRRDQIWFVDRNKFGSSKLYPMSEFDTSVVKNTSDYKKKYLKSVFGAAESMEITHDLISLINE